MLKEEDVLNKFTTYDIVDKVSKNILDCANHGTPAKVLFDFPASSYEYGVNLDQFSELGTSH